MARNKEAEGERIVRTHKKWKLWQKAVTGLACVVVFCTTYALILPAITMSGEPYCGKTEHTHTDACYEDVLICDIPEDDIHAHSAACYKTENTLICSKEQTDGHTHEDSCFETASKCICGSDETPAHHHSDSCYEDQTVLTCSLPEDETHTHGDSCYGTERVLICTEAETDGHTHSEACFEDITECICGQDECPAHHHDESCYKAEDVLACGLTEGEPHVHSEACYEKQLTCTEEEHVHGLACYSDPNADLESESDWVKTFEKTELTGNWADDVLAVAATQLGYKESTANYIVDENGNTKGYTRYGAWYGNAYGDWCAMFVSFCLHYADIPTDSIPYEAGCDNWIKKLSGEIKGYDFSLYHAKEEVEFGVYEIKPGDLVFLNWDNEPDADHVGLVKEIETDESGKQIAFTTIEGNAGNIVKEKTYELDNKFIMGFGELPENPDAEGSKVITTDAEKQESKTFTAECGEYVVTATYAADALLPAGAVLSAEPVTDDDTLNSVDAYLENSCLYTEKEILQLRLMVDDKPYNVVTPVDLDIAIPSPTEETDSELMIVQMMPDEFESLPLQTSAADGMIHCRYTQETLSNVALVFGVDSKHTLTFEGEDYSIIATYSDAAGFPDDVELSVTEILGDELQNKCDELTNMEETGDIQYARLFDITFLADGVELEPAVPVQIQIIRKDLVDLTENMEPGIVHFGEEENEILDVELTTEEDGAAAFEFEGATFSVYASYISDPFAETATSTHPATIATVDTKSLGITINMFDYWGSREHAANGDDNADTIDKNWTNGSSDYVFDGINNRHMRGTSLSYRLQQYLYFSASGPTFNDSDSGIAGSINEFTGSNDGNGGKARQGIVNSTLTNGYPTLATNGESLSYLFAPNNGQSNKRDYLNLNHLFKDVGNGYISYCSDDNYARLDTSTGNFKVYSETFKNADGSMIGFFPFNDYNSTKTEVKGPSDKTNYYNHHFGLTMTASFVIPEGRQVNGEDEIFYFSGDDDMWLYIDGVLVLDIGGIHEPCDGEINFTKGTVTIGKNYSQAGVVSASPGASSTIGKDSTLEKIFAAAGKTWDGSEESEHVIQIFYMERGGCYSNLTLTMNIPFFAELPIAVTKDTEGEAKTDDADTEFTFQIMVETAKGSNTYEPYTGSLNVTGGSSNRTISADSSGYFQIKAGETATTSNTFKSTRKYYVSEIGVDGTRYETVKINDAEGTLPTNIDELIENGDVEVTYDEETSRFKISQLPTSLYKLNNTNITNVIREEKTSLSVKKEWYDGNENHSSDTIKFKIYQKDVNDPNAEKQLYTYDGKTEFELSASDNWQKTFTDLPKKTLGHEYEYSAEEIDVKDGYTVSYSDPETDEDGNTSITIVNGPEVNITVQKKWFRNDGVTELDGQAVSNGGIQVQLWRDYYREAEDNSHTVTFVSGRKNQQYGNFEATVTTCDVADSGQVVFWGARWEGDNIPSVTITSGKADSPITSTLKSNGRTYTVYTINNIKSDITIYLNMNDMWENHLPSLKNGFHITNRTEPVTLPEESGREKVGFPVTLDKSNRWSYSWGTLETPATASDGTIYTYYVEELGTFNTYTVSYVNNSISEDTEDRTIIVKNTLIEYELPETGGSGTILYTMGGIALILTSFVLLAFSSRRRRERRVQ